MSNLIVIGSQWGDEGKGKFVDVLAEKMDGVVRFQGGANAGHTIIVNDKKTVLHLVPSGILHSHVRCYVGHGVSMDPFEILREIQNLKGQGYLSDDRQLCISDGTLLVLPFHRHLDRAREWHSNRGIGTTGRGIGPSYEDRASRRAILFRDLFYPSLKDKLNHCLEEKNFLLEKFYNQKPVDGDCLYEELLTVSEKLKVYRTTDMSLELSRELQSGKKFLFEGAQGVLLDNCHGSFPFVTSSQTTSSSAFSSLGVRPENQKVIGVTKAYCTRVGKGPFPTEDRGQTGEELRKRGREFGATTGRPRRCGWLDLVALRYAIRVGGMDELILTKLDVLSHFDRIKICTHYDLSGKRMADFALISQNLDQVEPVYREMEGWKRDLSDCQNFDDLPKQLQEYVKFIEDQVHLPVSILSVGPGRESNVYRR